MKVLEVLNHFPGETFIKEHIKAIKLHAPEIHLQLAYTQTPFTGKITSPIQNVEAYAWPNYNLMPQWKQWVQTLQYPGNQWYKLQEPQRRLLNKLKPDHVHFHFSNLAIKYGPLCTELQIPYSFSIRGTEIHLLKAEAHDTNLQQLKQAGSKAKNIHAVSTHLSKSLQTITGLQSTVIRTTLDVTSFKPVRLPEKNHWIAVGRLVWQKGFAYLIRACALLNTRNFKLTIIGEGPMRAELEFMIKDLGLENQIKLVGHQAQKELLEYFGKAEGLICSSIAEGFPNILVEAIASQLPIITTNIGDIKELLPNNDQVQLIPPASSEAIANGLQHWITSTPTLSIQTQRQLASLFAPQKHAEAFVKFYGA
ncbi:MAG: glycosyltransferase family 4 protein [Bacteroidia bacterium]|jgi:glycosyltransferase involved in cell wall biosynthesis|nr:glycosyltransferase family 4 protein [Bacteroidia bacterium]